MSWDVSGTGLERSVNSGNRCKSNNRSGMLLLSPKAGRCRGHASPGAELRETGGERGESQKDQRAKASNGYGDDGEPRGPRKGKLR